jgi:hypothetical protein
MRPARMERLWSRAVATSGNRWQMGPWRKGRNQVKTVALGCDRLPPGPHGREGVDGSSPSEALQKPCKGRFSFRPDLHDIQRAPSIEPFMELPGSEADLKSAKTVRFTSRVQVVMTSSPPSVSAADEDSHVAVRPVRRQLPRRRKSAVASPRRRRDGPFTSSGWSPHSPTAAASRPRTPSTFRPRGRGRGSSGLTAQRRAGIDLVNSVDP